MAPKFRVPAAFVSPAAIFMVGTAAYFLTRKIPSDEDLEDTIYKTYPQVRSTWISGKH